jgi:O-antigen ligase
VVSILKFFSWLFGILLASLIFIVPIWNNLNLEIINRMTSFYTERQIGGKIEERDFEWASAWRQFVENPIFGDSFVNDFDKSYAHNLFLDSLMATGVVGTILLIYLTYKSFSSFIKSSRSLKVQLLPIWITYLSILILSLTSGGLFVAFPFWIMLAVTIKIPIYANYKY